MKYILNWTNNEGEDCTSIIECKNDQEAKEFQYSWINPSCISQVKSGKIVWESEASAKEVL